MTNKIGAGLLDLPSQFASIGDEIREAIGSVLKSQIFVLGPEVEALESELAAYTQSEFAIGCGSGSDALILALEAAGVAFGEQVICPTFTFFATAGSIWRIGAEPVFCDIEPVYYTLDPAGVEAAVRGCRQLKAILGVHLYGQAFDVRAIADLADNADVCVIEDAAQAIGTRAADGRRIGSHSRAATFSFYPTKNLGGYGEGGMVTTNDADLAADLEKRRSHGMSQRYFHDFVGVNSRLDAIQAAVLRVKLRHLDAWNERRRAHADLYDAIFAAAHAADSSSPLADGGFPLRSPARRPAPAEHTFHQYVIRVPEGRRDSLREHLTSLGVGTAIYYPLPLHRQACFASLGHAEGDFPVAEAAARETLALPVHADLHTEQVEQIAEAIVAFLD